ncbi:multidrug ABC transporter ATP-binding protein [Mycolicibacterium agri]|uniref:Multidrug ABC transporter ATP-binding protein n=1 Tax=Mycolicibacterium agri TaxID=36811 RepID=A0A2A7N2I3_MYCAG|nr:ABC transporter ATP-binding protein/permease [Mycolicibacterium agri]PEG38104.1 multidrug ABC transporter ATP-binding protein [Mycolicibacterium agri]GFG48827.1 vitamin B12 transport ATP-binding protein BacA [Mycolicibacterium agri]
MNTGAFRSSIDWSHEFVNSSIWVLLAFAITAPCVLIVLVLIGRITEWGRQFWRITGPYFTGRQSLVVWVLLSVLLVLTIISVRITVLLSYYANDVFTALQVALQGLAAGERALTDSGIHGFWVTIGIFVILAVVHVVVTLTDIYVMQRFIMRWRIWLSGRLIDDWLDERAYYRRQFLRHPTDNPDQRIQQDIDIFTTGVGGHTNNPLYGSGSTLLFGAVAAVLSVASFGSILWRLSGPLTLAGLTIPRALFWIVIGYVSAATVVAFIIGRPLIRLSYLNELRNAGFRYALMRVRDASAAIGLYRGEDVERRLLQGRLADVMANYANWLTRFLRFTGWNLTVSQAINPLPYVVQAPRLFAGQISFGDVIQSATAFTVIHGALSFFREAYDEFASYRAAVIRLDGLVDENSRARRFSQVTTALTSDGALTVDDLDVHTPDGVNLIRALRFALRPGDTLLVSGPSGIGKTVLLQSIAGLWPFASGRVALPSGSQAAMFVPQLPYLPLGDLRAVASYPNEVGAVDDREIQRALIKVALPQLAIRLNDVGDWGKVLSVGEQQRIAFARILLTRPAAVFLDESTSALDEGLELTLYELIRAELPEAILVSVSHRATVERFHERQLELVGGGKWRLDPVRTRR